MIDDFAKAYLHNDLKEVREAIVGTLDGLAELDIRRPLTASGTNLLGLVKHLAIWESRYLGEVFDRPFTESFAAWDASPDPGADLWATADESRDEIIDRYRRVAAHADATIDALDIGAPGHVWWWPRPDVKLLNVLVHRIAETNRHAGHADILREQLDGASASDFAGATADEEARRVERVAKIQLAADQAAAPSDRNPRL